MESVEEKISVTKRQRIWMLIAAGVGPSIVIGTGIFSIVNGKRSPNDLILFGASTLIFAGLVIAAAVALVKTMHKEEDPEYRNKLLNSPVHRLENLQIAIMGFQSLAFGSSFIFIKDDMWVMNAVCYTIIFGSIPLSFYFRKKIRAELAHL